MLAHRLQPPHLGQVLQQHQALPFRRIGQWGRYYPQEGALSAHLHRLADLLVALPAAAPYPGDLVIADQRHEPLAHGSLLVNTQQPGGRRVEQPDVPSGIGDQHPIGHVG